MKVSDFGREQTKRSNAEAKRYASKHEESHREEDSLNVNKKVNASTDSDGNTFGTGSGGADSSEGKYIGKIDYERASEAISYFNGQIKNEVVENAVAIDKSGRTFHFIGDTNSVSFDSINLEGAYITHNHPESNGILSFGKSDFEFLKVHQKIALFSCCNPKYEYFIKVLKDFSDVSYNDIYTSGFKYAVDLDYEAQDAAMKILAERGYIEYVKRRIE